MTTFDSLTGEIGDEHNAVIRLCLIEKLEGLSPKELKNIGCILDEFAENSKVIARDIFKFLTLEIDRIS